MEIYNLFKMFYLLSLYLIVQFVCLCAMMCMEVRGDKQSSPSDVQVPGIERRLGYEATLASTSVFQDFPMKHLGFFNSAYYYFQPSINTTNIDTLLVATDQTERIVEPPENIQEKIAFIFNNLSQSNMTQKVSMM